MFLCFRPSLLMLLGLLVLKSLNSLSLCQLIYSHSFDNHAFTDNFQTYNCQSSLFPELRPCGYLSVYIPEPQTQQQWISCPPSQTCSFSHIVCLSEWNLLSTTALASLLIAPWPCLPQIVITKSCHIYLGDNCQVSFSLHPHQWLGQANINSHLTTRASQVVFLPILLPTSPLFSKLLSQSSFHSFATAV